ncbi:DUF4368 domain-containing protein [Christensenellaceae bacterium OttesenSCG-928-K19]|nr:DUF4368 domain-containing protein [Christensenellaceae bacterium OttesenSCG-928-K19]
MISGYKQERESLTARLENLIVAIAEAEQENTTISEFMELITQYIHTKEFDRVIVHELIEKIVVHQAEHSDGQRKQQIDIYFRFIGKLQ